LTLARLRELHVNYVVMRDESNRDSAIIARHLDAVVAAFEGLALRRLTLTLNDCVLEGSIAALERFSEVTLRRCEFVSFQLPLTSRVNGCGELARNVPLVPSAELLGFSAELCDALCNDSAADVASVVAQYDGIVQRFCVLDLDDVRRQYFRHALARDRLRDHGDRLLDPSWTALHFAAAVCCADVVRLLLQHCDVSARSRLRGETPLIVAIRYKRQADVCRLLLAAGADPTLCDVANYGAAIWNMPLTTLLELLDSGDLRWRGSMTMWLKRACRHGSVELLAKLGEQMNVPPHTTIPTWKEDLQQFATQFMDKLLARPPPRQDLQSDVDLSLQVLRMVVALCQCGLRSMKFLDDERRRCLLAWSRIRNDSAGVIVSRLLPYSSGANGAWLDQ